VQTVDSRKHLSLSLNRGQSFSATPTAGFDHSLPCWGSHASAKARGAAFFADCAAKGSFGHGRLWLVFTKERFL